MTLAKKNKKAPMAAGDSFTQIGLTLKGARRSQGLSVKEVSEQLRISVDYLTKLEASFEGSVPDHC